MASTGGYSINSSPEDGPDENTPLLTGSGQQTELKAGTEHLVETDHVI